MTSPQRFPLAWPAHRPRTSSWDRKPGRFSADGKDVTLAVAVDRLEGELGRLGALYAVLSTNVELRLDGRPRSGQRAPSDPGACVYFSLKGKPFALACDRYRSVEQNIAALAAHIEAMRAMTRHGVSTAVEALQAFTALPPPSSNAAPPVTGWRETLGLSASFPGGLCAEDALALLGVRYRERAAKAHPDNGGSDEAMAALNAARDAARREITQ